MIVRSIDAAHEAIDLAAQRVDDDPALGRIKLTACCRTTQGRLMAEFSGQALCVNPRQTVNGIGRHRVGLIPDSHVLLPHQALQSRGRRANYLCFR